MKIFIYFQKLKKKYRTKKRALCIRTKQVSSIPFILLKNKIFNLKKNSDGKKKKKQKKKKKKQKPNFQASWD